MVRTPPPTSARRPATLQPCSAAAVRSRTIEVRARRPTYRRDPSKAGRLTARRKPKTNVKSASRSPVRAASPPILRPRSGVSTSSCRNRHPTRSSNVRASANKASTTHPRRDSADRISGVSARPRPRRKGTISHGSSDVDTRAVQPDVTPRSSVPRSKRVTDDDSRSTAARASPAASSRPAHSPRRSGTSLEDSRDDSLTAR
jgi:hypothetical protein